MTNEDPWGMLTMVSPLSAWGLSAWGLSAWGVAVSWAWPAHRGCRPLRPGKGSAGRGRRGRCRYRSGLLLRRTARCCSSTCCPLACRAIALLRVPIVSAVSVPGSAPLGGMPRSAHRFPIWGGEAHLGLLANIQDCVAHSLRLPVGIGFEVALEVRCCL